jgi:hypothetical protein
MIAVVLLTSENRWIVAAGGLAIIVFSFSKETIVSAMLQAFAYWVRQWWVSNPRGLRQINWIAMIVLFVAGALIVASRGVVTYLVGGSPTDYLPLLYEDGVFRIYANYLHVIENTGALQSVFLFGFGMVVWLPVFWYRLSGLTKWLMVASLPPFIILLFVDNFTELRCYSELVPLIAVAFGQVLLGPAKKSYPPVDTDLAQGPA